VDLADVLGLEFVFGELQPENLLCVRYPFQGIHGNGKQALTESADSGSGNLTKPLHHPKIAFWHG
jgi:hypothetical protein